ncbi:hypothetical protein SLS54_008646 [Diplodia seriata]
MAAEFAAFGAFGTALSLFTFLTTTIEILNKKYFDFIDGADRLDHCRDEIIVIDLELKNWRRTWHDKYGARYADTTYEMFWGLEGYEVVKKMAARIDNEAQKLINHLYYNASDSRKFSEHLKSQWRGLLRERRSLTNGHSLPNDTIRRLCYALFQEKKVKDDIDRLKAATINLGKFSRTTYWTLLDPDIDVGKWVDPKELRIINGFREHLSRAVDKTKIFSSRFDPKDLSLVLGYPDCEQSLRNLEDGVQFQLQFVVEKEGACQLLLVEVDPSTGNSGPRVSNLDPNINLNGLDNCMDIKALLRSMAFNSLLRKTNESTLGLVAANLAKSVVLLYGAPWTRGVCTCGIRIRDMRGENEDICTFQETDLACHDTSRREQRFLNLAAALAELCIAMPVQPISGAGQQYEFEVHSLMTQEREIIGEDTLLRKVQLKSGSRAYKAAVNFCLDLARSEGPDGSATRPERIRQSPEQLVRP